LFTDSQGAGCFVNIGLFWPQVMVRFVGVVEIACGVLLLIGLRTRFAAVPLNIDILVALYVTERATFSRNGFWGTLHVAGADVITLLGLVFLLLVGAGAWSFDARLAAEQD
jgi:uncharacterized membrane protein YphA (DoxX/SURF4 family)